MRVDRSILAVGVVIGMALLAAGVALWIAPAGAAEGYSDVNRTIQVGATADLTDEANQAVVTVGVVKRADNATDARQQVADNVSSVIAALKNAGITDTQIQTVDYQIGNTDRDHIEDYRAEHTLQINVTDLDNAGTVIDTAVANGGNQIENVRFGLDAETREQLRERALEQAVANARQKAKTIAGEAKLTVTGVVSVTSSDVGYRPHRREVYLTSASDDASAGGAPTTIEGGPVSVSAQVEVVFEATE